MKFLFWFLLLINTAIFSQSQFSWFWQNPRPQGNTIDKLFFLDMNNGFAAVRNGIFMKTFDGGDSWLLYSPVLGAYDFNDVYFKDNSEGFLTGDSGKIIRTIDGGENWSEIISGTDKDLLNITFTSSSTGYISGNNNTILKTTDGGMNWNNVFMPDTGVYFFTSQFFLNDQTGYVAGSGGIIFKTTDGGNEWIELDSPGNLWVDCMYFFNSESGFIGGLQGKLYKTTNGGNDWELLQTGTTFWLRSITFSDPLTGYIASTGGKVLKTTDGGENWVVISPGTSANFADVTVSGNRIIVSGINGTLLRSTNSGTDWHSLRTGAQGLNTGPTGHFDHLNSIYFINSSTGFASGERSTILKTTNGGDDWFKLQSDTSGEGGWYLTSVFFTDENNGFISGDYGYFERTTDGGNTWIRHSTGTTQWLTSVYFINNSTGFLSGDAIHKTTNSGISWIRYSVDDTLVLNGNSTNDVYFINDNTGFTVSYGAIYKSTDGGETWINKMMGVNARLNSIRFFDINNGYAAGERGKLFKTTDGGETWNETGEYSIYYDFSSLHIFDPLTVIAAGKKLPYIGGGALIVKTTDGGISWYEQVPYSSGGLNSIFFSDPVTGYAAGNFGSIIKTITAGEHPSGITHNSDENISAPVDFILEQNYPNPFNPATIIKFSITDRSPVQLAIYDILGKKVDLLLNDILEPGNYSFNWDASEFSTGVYFYRLTSGGKSLTKKMLLMK